MKTNKTKTNKTKTNKTNKTNKKTRLVNNYTRKQKQQFTDQILHLEKEDILKDFSRLREIGCDLKGKEISRIGNNTVNKFTLEERLNTIGNKGVSFFDVWKNHIILKKQYPYLQQMVNYYKNHKINISEIKMWVRIFNLYYGSISIFKPLTAMDIYCKYKPTSILDFTMGWGGRLVGACALDIPKYTGIDYNDRLIIPYKKLTTFMQENSKTKIKTYFEDALTIDYSKIDYDMVLTSPPYYNIEIYGGQENTTQKQYTKDEWDIHFYIPIIEKTFKYLKKGGHYCLNIPVELYERVAKKILGKPNEKILLVKSKRLKGEKEKYHEYIYVWVR